MTWKPVFDAGGTGIEMVQVSNHDDLSRVLPGIDVLVVSGLWTNDLLVRAPRLKYLQSISSGTNPYDLEPLRNRGHPAGQWPGV